MSNAASLRLLGSNLTNLIVLARHKLGGTRFAGRMVPAWIASCAVTAGPSAARYSRLGVILAAAAMAAALAATAWLAPGRL